MAYRVWDVNGHTVELVHSWWTGRATLTVDGRLVFTRPSPPGWVDFGFTHRFEVDRTPCAVRVRITLPRNRLELFTGDEAVALVEADERISPEAAKAWAVFTVIAIVYALLDQVFRAVF